MIGKLQDSCPTSSSDLTMGETAEYQRLGSECDDDEVFQLPLMRASSWPLVCSSQLYLCLNAPYDCLGNPAAVLTFAFENGIVFKPDTPMSV